MGGASSQRIPQNAEDLIGGMTKRLLHEERRPLIRTASDLLGPGIGPTAVQLFDWNDEATEFNGFFYSDPGALNSPDPALYWMGTSETNADGYGFQRVTEYRNQANTAIAPQEWVRTFSSAAGVTRTFGSWENVRSGQVRKVVSASTNTASALTSAVTAFLTVLIPFPVNGYTYRATMQGFFLNDTAGAFTTVDLRSGSPVSTASTAMMDALVDHRLANRRQSLTVVGEVLFTGTTGASNFGIMASFVAGSGNSQNFCDGARPTLLTVDEIIP